MTISETMEKMNGGALCSYYGSLDNSIKPKYGAHYFMLDEYMQRTMEQLTDKAKNDFQKMNATFEKSREDEKKALKESINKLSNEIKDLITLVKNIVNDNKLKMPKKLEVEK